MDSKSILRIDLGFAGVVRGVKDTPTYSVSETTLPDMLLEQKEYPPIQDEVNSNSRCSVIGGEQRNKRKETKEPKNQRERGERGKIATKRAQTQSLLYTLLVRTPLDPINGRTCRPCVSATRLLTGRWLRHGGRVELRYGRERGRFMESTVVVGLYSVQLLEDLAGSV
jgi:hypothetical protein